jgi:Receptor L domain
MSVVGRWSTVPRRAATSCVVGVALFGLASGCGRTDHDTHGSDGGASGGAQGSGTAGSINDGGSGHAFAGSTASSGTMGMTPVAGGSAAGGAPGGGDRNEAGAPTLEPGPCTGDRSVRSQADYEALVAEQCTEISGDLTITQDGELSSKPGLRTLTRVGGTLMVDANPALTSLLTFAGLESIGGDFTLRGDGLLSSLAGLEHLKNVGGLRISGTPVSTLAGLESLTSLPHDLIVNGPLKSLKGPKLTSIGGRLELTDTLLESLAGLEQLTSLETLQIVGAPQLMSTDGLSSLMHVDRVEISGVPARSLSGFDHITELAKGLSLQDCAGLTSLESFSTVSRIGGGIQINGNDALESLRGLDHLLETPELVIDGNAALTSLTGLEGLENVTSLDISGNDALGSLSALAALKQVHSLGISSNPMLTSLEGIERVTQVDSLSINADNALTSLHGLEQLTDVGGLGIEGNGALTSLHGLEQLTHVGGLLIAQNPVLSTLAAFMSWPAHALAGCHIDANPVLPQCQVDALADAQLDVDGCSNEGGLNLEDATCD